MSLPGYSNTGSGGAQRLGINFAARKFDTGYSKIEELENKLFETPSTPFEIKLNRKTSKQILIEKARLELKKGWCRSLRMVAKKYGLNHGTLEVFIKNPNLQFRGRGKNSYVLSEEEEQKLAKRMHQMLNEGKKLNQRIIGDSKELEVIQRNEPERLIQIC